MKVARRFPEARMPVTLSCFQNSPIDFIIWKVKFKKLKFRKMATRMYDHWDLDYPVDFLCYTPEELNKLKGQVTLVEEAVEEGIEIYKPFN